MSDRDPSGSAGRSSGPPARASAASTAVDPRCARLVETIRDHLIALRPDLAAPLIQELRAAAPALEFVELAERAAAIIAFRRPLPRAPYVPAPRTPPAADALDLVAFHVDLPRAPSGVHQAVDYTTALALSFESARLRAPLARRILLTDLATHVHASIDAEVRRFPLDASRLMYERMRVQSLYLEGREPGRASVLLDSDVVVNQDPAAVFGETFDVALTWRREFPEAPFNGGVIFVAEGSAGLRFFGTMLACYDALAADAAIRRLYPRGVQGWWGDQFALGATVGLREFHQRGSDGVEVDGVRVRFFPCDTHNYTMAPDVQHLVEDLRRKYFIHFKGNRKAMQAQYLDFLRRGIV